LFTIKYYSRLTTFSEIVNTQKCKKLIKTPGITGLRFYGTVAP
jgi:hypothetical protein